MGSIDGKHYFNFMYTDLFRYLRTLFFVSSVGLSVYTVSTSFIDNPLNSIETTYTRYLS